jgi:hypothetical protein
MQLPVSITIGIKYGLNIPSNGTVYMIFEVLTTIRVSMSVCRRVTLAVWTCTMYTPSDQGLPLANVENTAQLHCTAHEASPLPSPLPSAAIARHSRAPPNEMAVLGQTGCGLTNVPDKHTASRINSVKTQMSDIDKKRCVSET